MKKKQFVLVDAQDSKELELHVAFKGNDNDDQIVCELPETVVLELVKSYYELNEYRLPLRNFEIDADVREYIKEKWCL